MGSPRTSIAVTHALTQVIEANILLSGLGFESGGLACAHALHNGLTVHKDTHSLLHGEKVAFSTIVQLCLEGQDREAERIARFFHVSPHFCRRCCTDFLCSDLAARLG